MIPQLLTFRKRVAAASIAALSIFVLAHIAGCDKPAPPDHGQPVKVKLGEADGPLARLPVSAAATESPIRFTEISREAGIEFVYYGNPSPEHYMTEQNGGGVALFDYDGDHELDVFLVNGSNFDRPAEAAGASNRMYRAVGRLKYQDVTESAGLQAFGFGMGCAAGDYDNDGFDDLFVAGYGRNRLWRNNGDGTFSEVELPSTTSQTRKATDAPLWGCAGAFADLDGDGNLDLYVVNYVDFRRDDPPCFTQHQPPVRISCGPLERRGQPDILYHNLADGAFADISQPAGISEHLGKGLAVSVADFDDDGRLDVYVVNDTNENLLFLNRGGMRFDEVGLTWGVAVGSDGVGRSGMGVACADYNGDGRFDLFVTNFQNEPNDLYENLGENGFQAMNTPRGLDTVFRPVLGWGAVFADFDLDHHPDLFVANGHVWDLTSTGLGYEYEMQAHVLRNNRGAVFANVSDSAGAYFQKPWLGRAVAAGDLDRDGDTDLIVTHLVQPAAVLRNDSQTAGRSVRLRLIGRSAARLPLGVRADYVVDGKQYVTRVPAGDGYQSSSDSRVMLTVGQSDTIDELQIHWPGQAVETWKQIPTDPELTLIQGSGTAERVVEPVVKP